MKTFRESLKAINAALGGTNDRNETVKSIISEIADNIGNFVNGNASSTGALIVEVSENFDESTSTTAYVLNKTAGEIISAMPLVYLASSVPEVNNDNGRYQVYWPFVTDRGGFLDPVNGYTDHGDGSEDTETGRYTFQAAGKEYSANALSDYPTMVVSDNSPGDLL